MDIKTIGSKEELNKLHEEGKLIGFFYIENDLYHEGPGLNHSTLKNIFPPNTPLDFKFKSQFKYKSKAKDFGNACHIAAFEPEILDESIVVMPEINRRTKVGKEEYAEFMEASKGKIVLTEQEVKTLENLKESMSNHPVVGGLITNSIGCPEIAGYFKYGKHLCKFKCDYLLFEERVVLDLKTTRHDSPYLFEQDCRKLNYDTAAAFYCLGLNILTGYDFDFVWVVVEKNPPHKTYLTMPGPDWFERADETVERALALYDECTISGEWPGQTTDIITLDGPKWFVEGGLRWS